jgi:membrane-anchored protein YejM (alkaline phosphatase superfamily)
VVVLIIETAPNLMPPTTIIITTATVTTTVTRIRAEMALKQTDPQTTNLNQITNSSKLVVTVVIITSTTLGASAD